LGAGSTRCPSVKCAPADREIISLSSSVSEQLFRPLDNSEPTLAHQRSGVQIRTARVALGWSDAPLASRARLGTATVQRAESAEVPPITVGNLFAIQRALEEGGIIFIEDGQQSLFGGPGVRLR